MSRETEEPLYWVHDDTHTCTDEELEAFEATLDPEIVELLQLELSEIFENYSSSRPKRGKR